MSQDAHTSSNPPGAGDPRLEAYLDGLLEGEELSAFERLLHSNPALRAQVEAQERIDDSLARLFPADVSLRLRATTDATVPAIEPPGGVERSKPRLAIDAPPARRWTFRSSALTAMAAALLLTFVGLYATGLLGPTDLLGIFGQRQGLISPVAVYERKVEHGFHPDWVCENDEQFVETTRSLWGESLIARGNDAVSIVGWSYYEPVLSSTTAILLTRVEGREVIVVMDRLDKDRTLRAPKDSGLRYFRAEMGNVVLYEVTPFDEPRVLPLFESVAGPLK